MSARRVDSKYGGRQRGVPACRFRVQYDPRRLEPCASEPSAIPVHRIEAQRICCAQMLAQPELRTEVDRHAACERLRRGLREHRVAQGRTCALTDEHRRLVTRQAIVRLQKMAEILQVAVGKDALFAVALQLRE